MATKKEVKEAVNYPDLSGKSLTELLELKDATKFLIDYYGNFARANTGNYEFNSEELYQAAKKLVEKYNNVYNRIIEAIENKINKELF